MIEKPFFIGEFVEIARDCQAAILHPDGHLMSANFQILKGNKGIMSRVWQTVHPKIKDDPPGQHIEIKIGFSKFWICQMYIERDHEHAEHTKHATN